MIFESICQIDRALAAMPAPDTAAIAAASARQAELTKPPGSLGMLEDIVLFLAGWQGRERPALADVRAVVFAGNHGVATHGVSAFPPEVTAQMVANFSAGGAAINALSRAAEIDLHIVPLDLDRPTADFTCAAAMTEAECLAAMSAGAATVEPGLDLFIAGEMGIANTTSAAALAARAFGGSGAFWVGRGSGVDAAGVERKAAVIDAGLELHGDAGLSPFEILRRLGGREIAAMAGAMLRARMLRVPVLLDGFVATAAIAPFAAACPGVTDHCLAGHRSAERGHGLLLERLEIAPLLSLGMRLGEGSGAAVAVHILRAAVAVHAEMATFAEAGVAGAR